MYSSSSESGSIEARVAVFEIDASTPPIRTRFPAAISSAGMKYLRGEPAVNKCPENRNVILPGLRDPQVLHCRLDHIFLVFWRVPLPENFDLQPFL